MGSAATHVNSPLILKNVWEDSIADYFVDEMPFMGLVKHDSSWDGLYRLITVATGGMAGRSATFGDAKANKSPTTYKQMQVEVRDNFATWSVDHKLITLSRNDRGALVRALTENTEAAIKKLKASQNFMNWRNGGGCVGKFSTASGATGTLVDVNDVRNFDIDDVIEFSSDDGTGGAGVHPGSAKITGINEDTGVITFDTTLSTIHGFATSDYLFHQGDYNLVFAGVQTYCPVSDPGTSGVSSTVWGMPRTSHPTLLAGSRFTASNLLLIETLKSTLATAFRRRIKTTHIFAPPEIYNDIEMSLQGQRRYVEEKSGSVGYNALVFTVQGGGSVKVYPDADIPKSADGTSKYIFGLNLPEWKFHTAGEYPSWLNTVANGGTKFMVEQNANATEGRLGGYGQLYTKNLKSNWVLTLT
jgi:hypothetical protein